MNRFKKKMLPVWLAGAVASLGGAATSVAETPTDAAIPVATTAETQESCTTPRVERPFISFGDQRNYVLAPGGSFESPDGAGWTFAGGAAIVTGSERSWFWSAAERSSLLLPPGASAVSPVMCVDRTYPTMRLFVREVGNASTELDVSVYYPDDKGSKPKRVATLRPTRVDEWTLSADIDVRPETIKRAVGYSRVIFLFDAVPGAGKTGYQLDDLYVDPRMGR